MLKIQTKASQISNLTDARYFAAWDVNWLGFNLNPEAESRLSAVEMKAIKEWVEGPKMIGEFGNLNDKDQLISAVSVLELDGIQVGMFTEIDVLEGLEKVYVIQEWVLEKASDLEWMEEKLAERKECVNSFLLNLSTNGIELDLLDEAGRTLLKKLCSEFNIILNANIKPEQLDFIQNELNPEGISVTGGEEEKVGFKSFDELDDLFEALEITV